MKKGLIFLITIVFFFSTKALASPVEVENWIGNNHIIAPLDEPMPDSLQNSLKASLVGKRMVFLGESDHYFHEKFKYRLKFIEQLLDQGFYNIIAELGLADGKMVNKYLETGDEDYLKKVGLYGFNYGHDLKYRKGNFTKELVRYYKKLRKLKEKYPQLTYTGFDLDAYPGTFLLEFEDFKNTKLYQELLRDTDFEEVVNLISDVQKNADNMRVYPAVNELIFLLQEALEKTILLPTKFTDLPEMKEFVFDFRIFLDSVVFRRKMIKKEYTSENFAWREKRMFQIMTKRFMEDPRDHKYIFLGHNGHLVRTDEPNAKGESYTSWATIGDWITDRNPDEVFAIWSFIGRGEHSGHGCPFGNTCSFEAKKDSLEEDLLKIASSKEIYFRNSSVIEKHEDEIFTLDAGTVEAWGKYGSLADAFYFIPVVQDLKAEEN